MVFPEGGTTNNNGVMKFKKGAFVSELTVKPCFIKYKHLDCGFDPSFNVHVLPMVLL